MMSDFYNLLQMRSKILCKMFTELAVLENSQKQEKIYQTLFPAIEKYVCDKNPNIIISTTPLINRYMIRYIRETQKNIKYIEVITDPYIPMYPGFDVDGASIYFCPTIAVKRFLLKQNIPNEKIIVSGYPILETFLVPVKKYNFKGNEKENYNILLNSGANGLIKYTAYVDALLKNFRDIKIIIICGNNKSLYKSLKEKYPNEMRLDVRAYEKNMPFLLQNVDINISKPGANTIFECIGTNTPILIDAIDGLLYQESGICNFLEESQIGELFYDVDQLLLKLAQIINNYGHYYKNISSVDNVHGTAIISKYIIKLIKKDK